MARIVLSTMGSLGDLHPMIALGIELRRRGHDVVVNTWDGYEEMVRVLGFEFFPLRPSIDPTDREFIRRAMDTYDGPATIIRELIFPHLEAMYEDLALATQDADAMITGELLYVAKSLNQKKGIKWITTSLSPLTLFSFHDPGVFPGAEFLEYLRPLPSRFHRGLFSVMRLAVTGWLKPYRSFRTKLGLDPEHDPLFLEKFSDRLHLAMFSRALSAPQPDWPTRTVQTGFCFYDGQEEEGTMPNGLEEFLNAGKEPLVFTLGSAAVMDPRDFFDESVTAAKKLRRRAVIIYGRDNEPPEGLNHDIVGFPYVPFSRVFPRAACVVHQGGVGTTGQVLRAGIPHLIMPYGHDQPDNAARCRRIGVAESISRNGYTAESACRVLTKLLTDPLYAKTAAEYGEIVRDEGGATLAADKIERVL